MIGLHTRGCRPAPGDRMDGGYDDLDTRASWELSYSFVRSTASIQSGDDVMDARARACLAARFEPLDGRRVHMFYGGTLAESVAAYPLERS